MSKLTNEEMWIFELQAQFCKAMAHPKRLLILNILKERGEMTVSELVEVTGIAQANLSQHLRFLKDQGLLSIRKEGLNTYYSISDPRIVEACNLVRTVILERIRKAQVLLEKAKSS